MSKLILSHHDLKEDRWRWALYSFKYAGEGFRFHRVRDDTFRRWKVFFDIPRVGGLCLYIQDVP